MQFSNKIYELRKKHGLSQEQLAEKVGVARQTISKWELGETSPDIKQTQIISQIFGVSLDELIGNDTKETVNNTKDSEKKNQLPWKRIITISAAVLCLCLAIVGVFNIVKRSRILYPQGAEGTIAITKKEAIQIDNNSGKMLVFNEKNKPSILCEVPDYFIADEEKNGLYTDGDGNFIIFNADYADNIFNPLSGTDYFSHYASKGYDSYIEIAHAAMYYNHPKLGIFAPKEELYLAGGAKIIRHQLCAGQNADCYTVDGGLTSNGTAPLIYGFALHFDDVAWQIVLKDYENNYYFITIKDPNGVGKSIDAVSEFISYIYPGNASIRSNVLDSAAQQEARNAFMEYIVGHTNNANGCFVYDADNSRYVSFRDGASVGVYHSIKDALSATIDAPNPQKLIATDVEGLYIYNENSN